VDYKTRGDFAAWASRQSFGKVLYFFGGAGGAAGREPVEGGGGLLPLVSFGPDPELVTIFLLYSVILSLLLLLV
jgi:hypothetical protein